MSERTSVYTCSKCGRVISPTDATIRRWLIAERIDNPASLVVRCPQHITEWTLRMAGRRRTIRIYKWARRVKEADHATPPAIIAPLSNINHLIELRKRATDGK